MARELEIGRYCSLRTTVRGRQSTQDIALFIYHVTTANLSGSGLVVVRLDTRGELEKLFADAWFEKIWPRHDILRGSRMVRIAAAQFSFLTEHDRPQI